MTAITLTSSHPPHASAALTVPTTQNTAPVVEHRCLYTHDLRRKQKRWQDGFLKFHTFNNRVMVYDVPRNYIGDSHWRESDLVQDGDEIELDRGILVQVGEVIGRAEQDLSELIVKRKKAPDVQANGEHTPKTAVTNGTNTVLTQPPQMLKPKPLNVVLGTPKGYIGRAILPTKSPYDQRLEDQNLPRSRDRPLKRKRIEESPFNMSVVHSKSKESNTITSQPPSNNVRQADVGKFNASCENQVRYSSSKSRPSTRNLKSANFDVLDTPKAHLLTRGQDEASKIWKSRGKKTLSVSNEAVCVASSEDEILSTYREALRSKHSPREGVRTNQTSTKEPISSTKAGSIDVRSPQAQRANSKPSVNEEMLFSGKRKASLRLQIAPRKPRKKLMYRDIPPCGQSRTNEEYSTPVLTGDDGVLLRQSSGDAGSLSAFHQAEQDRIEARLEKVHTRQLNKENALGFRTQDDSALVRETTERKAQERTCGSLSDHQDGLFALLSEKQMYPVISTPKPAPYDTNLSLSKMDEMLPSRIQQTSKQSRSPPSPQSQYSDCERRECSTVTAAVNLHTDILDAGCHASSKTQIPSSPKVQPKNFQHPCAPTQSKWTARELSIVANTNENHQECILTDDLATAMIESSQPLLLEDSKSAPPSDEISPASQPLADPSLESELPAQLSKPPLLQDPPTLPEKTKSLPNFKPPTRRSPLKKVVSDISSVHPLPPAAFASAPLMGPAQTAAKKVGTEPVADAWSKEAWDLLGCGKDGVMCSFGEFVGQAG